MLLKYLPPPGSRNAARVDRLSSVWPTAATPPTFAPPVDIHEDEAAFTLQFYVGHLQERPPDSLEVSFAGSALFVLGEVLTIYENKRATRVFLLRSGIDTLGVSTRIEEPMLIVRIPKSAAGRRNIVVRRGE